MSYQWYLDDSAVTDQIGSTYDFTAGSTGSHAIYCKVTDSATTPFVVQSNTPSLVVSVSPTVSVSPVGPLTMDAGQTQLFTATPSGGSGAIHYQWYVGAVTVGPDSSTYTYTASGSSASISCIGHR